MEYSVYKAVKWAQFKPLRANLRRDAISVFIKTDRLWKIYLIK